LRQRQASNNILSFAKATFLVYFVTEVSKKERKSEKDGGDFCAVKS